MMIPLRAINRPFEAFHETEKEKTNILIKLFSLEYAFFRISFRIIVIYTNLSIDYAVNILVLKAVQDCI